MEKVIARINELAAIKKTRPLTPEENAEKKVLYQKYLAAIRGDLEAQLSSIRVVDENGEQRPLVKKERTIN